MKNLKNLFYIAVYLSLRTNWMRPNNLRLMKGGRWWTEWQALVLNSHGPGGAFAKFIETKIIMIVLYVTIQLKFIRN